MYIGFTHIIVSVGYWDSNVCRYIKCVKACLTPPRYSCCATNRGNKNSYIFGSSILRVVCQVVICNTKDGKRNTRTQDHLGVH